ncbi:hypothetical protein ACG02S_19745 [Roseateles sp. DC23W]|uniref:Uncharacterized protein n=1 Tax=Pelomonas dachongensis TaxID=3299029 RepID=A0ABW7ES33_9BURK
MSDVLVRVWPPVHGGPKAIKVRVHTSDFAVVGEGPAGWPMQVPQGEGYVASAIDGSGRAIGQPIRFDVGALDSELDLKLQPNEPSIKGRNLLQEAALPVVVAGGQSRLAQFDAPSAVAPAFHYVRILRRRARPKEVVDSEDFREMFAIERLASNLPPFLPSPESISAFGILFAGPKWSSRLALVPADYFNGRFEMPNIHWSETHTTGVYLPYFEFTDPDLNLLVGSLRPDQRVPTSATSALSSTSSALMPQQVGLGRVIAALSALDDPKRWEELDCETNVWADSLRWIPDAQVVRAELLARLGRHSSARAVLRKIAFRTLPWTRAALALLASRLSFYDRKEADSLTWRYRKIWYQNLLGQSHPSCGFCVFQLGNRHD